MANDNARKREQAARRKLAEKALRARTAQAGRLMGRQWRTYGQQQNQLRGMLGGFGALNSGLGSNVLAGANQLALETMGGISQDLNADLLKSQLAASQFEAGHGLDWAKLAAGERETEGRLALDRERMGVDRDRLGLDRELGVGDQAIRRLGTEGDLDVRRQQLAQSAEQAAAQRAHELSVQQGQQVWQSGESQAGRQHESTLQQGSQQFQGTQAQLGREHESALQQGTHQFQATQAGLGRGHEQAMATAQQVWQSGESQAGRQHESALQQGSQQFQAGQAQLGRQHESALQQGSQQFQGRESALDRELRQVQTEKELALREREVALSAASAEANRGLQRDQMAQTQALELARLAEQRAQAASQRELELIRLAQGGQAQQLAGMQSGMQLLAAGLNPANPMAQQFLGAAGYQPVAAGAPRPIAAPQRQPGQSDHEWQLAQMSDYWNRQRAAQAQQGNSVFLPQGGQGGPSDLDYFRAGTERMYALRALQGGQGGGGGMAAGGSPGGSALAPEDRRAASYVMEALQSGKLPNVHHTVLLRGLDAALSAGQIDQAQHAKLFERIGAFEAPKASSTPRASYRDRLAQGQAQRKAQGMSGQAPQWKDPWAAAW